MIALLFIFSPTRLTASHTWLASRPLCVAADKRLSARSHLMGRRSAAGYRFSGMTQQACTKCWAINLGWSILGARPIRPHGHRHSYSSLRGSNFCKDGRGIASWYSQPLRLSSASGHPPSNQGRQSEALDQGIHRGNDDQRQQGRGDHPADHRHGDALHDFRPRAYCADGLAE